MASRDEYTDAGRMGAPSRGKAQVMKDAIDMDAMTMSELKAANGWRTIAKPVGGEPPSSEFPEQY